MSSESHREKILKLIKAICARVMEREGYLTKTRLIKYLYLIDVEYFRRHGKTFTGLNWIFYDFGPWACEYNEIVGEMSKSGEFRIIQRNYPEYDIYFISSTEREEFDSVFDDFEDVLTAKRIVDKWVSEPLNSLLNYVYFKTEPMVDAERNKALDFRKIHILESIPKFKLKRGMKNPEEKVAAQSRIRERVLSAKKTCASLSDVTFTPPRYDDDYFRNMERMRIDDEY